MEIRVAGPGDERLLQLVGAATFLDAFAGVLPAGDIALHCEREHAAARYGAWLADGGSRLWLACARPGGAPVGYLVLTRPQLPLPDLGPADWEIKRIYLLHRHQGRGLGARLMSVAVAAAKSAGAQRLLLGVYAGNTPALGFYRRLGYADCGTREFRVGANTYHDLILALPLR